MCSSDLAHQQLDQPAPIARSGLLGGPSCPAGRSAAAPCRSASIGRVHADPPLHTLLYVPGGGFMRLVHTENGRGTSFYWFRGLSGLDSGPGMGFHVHVPELLIHHLGIDLGGGDVRVAQHLLDGFQIRPVFQQMGGEGVAQGVGRDILHNPRLLLIDRKSVV